MNIENLSLTDFTSKELNWLYLVLDERRKDFERKIEEVEKYFDAPSRLKFDLYGHYNEQYDLCTQFLTKVDEAAKFVKTREIMTTEN